MNWNKNIVLIGCFLLVISCANKEESNEYFEGIIDFDVEYIKQRPKADAQKEEEILGLAMKYYFKEGNYKKEYFNTRGDMVKKTVFNQETHLYYVEFLKSDTIYFYNPITPYHEGVEIKIIGNEEIIGEPCKIIRSKLSPKKDFGANWDLEVTYSLSENLKIDPAWFADVNYEAYSKVAEAGQGCYLKMHKIDGMYDTKEVAQKITRKKLDISEFEINTKKALVESK